MFKDLSLLLPYVRKYRGEFTQGVVTLVLASCCSATIPFLIKYAVDGLQAGLRSQVLRIIGIACVLAFTQAILRWRSRMKILNSSREIEYELRRDFYTHLISLPYSFFKEQHRGDLIARIMNDITNVRLMVGMSILHFSSTAATTILSLVMMLRLNALIALLAILPLCLLFVLIKGYMEKLHGIFKDVQDTYGRLSKGANEVLNGIRLVKNYLLHAEEQDRFEKLNREYMKKNLASTRLWGMVFPAIGFLGGMGTLIVMWLGGYFLMYGRITLGDFIALNAYYTMLMWPVVALAWIMNLYQRGVASVRRLEEIYAYPVEQEVGASPERIKGRLEFSGVSLMKGGRQILKDISFTVEPGEKLLLIGSTASGKSTILNLILGLDGEYEGVIRIDNLGADEISPIARRRRIAIVPQEPFLYSLPIRENIFADERAEAMVDAVQLEEEIERFEKKLETVVGERGVMLSGGQKQRLTLARALAMKPDVLLLDDPFTHVDGYTEHLIWEKIWPLIKDVTVIITSTRPVPVTFVDKVLVLSEGRIIDEGRPDELLERSPYMKLLYEVKTGRG
ncbi:MAG TPA: ABC transporter ATP-binding protein [Syntrophorhabdales bacterium]|nr:ABC transporter ATP-binding protein [Syntrophorhabdales bacterium]